MTKELTICGCCGNEGCIGFMDVPVCGSCSYHRTDVASGRLPCPRRVRSGERCGLLWGLDHTWGPGEKLKFFGFIWVQRCECGATRLSLFQKERVS